MLPKTQGRWRLMMVEAIKRKVNVKVKYVPQDLSISTSLEHDRGTFEEGGTRLMGNTQTTMNCCSTINKLHSISGSLPSCCINLFKVSIKNSLVPCYICYCWADNCQVRILPRASRHRLLMPQTLEVIIWKSLTLNLSEFLTLTEVTHM